ncbi:MAG: hypothetical protein ACREFZ_09890, partial [Acetobacteraceae bacterium]
QIHRLRQIGRRDPLAVLADPTVTPDWLAGVERVIVLATADPVSAAITGLEVRARELPIDVVVYAAETEADHFDAWGRPVASAWTDRLLPIADFEQRVHVSADPSAQSVRIADLARQYRVGSGRLDGWLAIGIADPEILAGIEGEAVRHGVPVYNPEGRRHRYGALYQLLSAVAQAARSPTFEAVIALARCPDFLAYLERRVGDSFSAANFLRALDDLNARHLPADLDAARRHAPGSLSAVLAAIDDVLATIAREPFPEGVSTVLGTVFEGRRIDPTRGDDAWLQDAAAAWTSVMRECAVARAAFGALGPFDWWELALRAFGDARVAEDKPVGALDLQGWLELTFEDAPHLVIGGFNDGLVPDAIAGDAFLPESLRVQLGLKSNAMRLARDAYLLHAIVASRLGAGRVDLLLGKTSATGDPLRPSRLLFRCPDAELPARVAFLFRTPEVPDSHLPWTRAWKLRPERVT